MKIYLAARYSMRNQLRQYKEELVEIGHTVTSRWLDTAWSIDEKGSSSAPPKYRVKFALIDLEDVKAADIFIHFNGQQSGRGGRHVEFGYALALGKIVIHVGEAEHLFHHHPSVGEFDDWGSLKETLSKFGEAHLPQALCRRR